MLFKKNHEAINVNDVPPKGKIIDIRKQSDVAKGKIAGSEHIEETLLLGLPDRYLKKDETYYIVAASGMKSSATCKKLAKMGYKVVDLKGGMYAYKGILVK